MKKTKRATLDAEKASIKEQRNRQLAKAGRRKPIHADRPTPMLDLLAVSTVLDRRRAR